MKRLLLATAAVLALAGSALAASDETRPLYFKQGSGPSSCQLQVNNKPTLCDIALLIIYGGNRTRVQFNNDDSGRMVVFEGKFAGQDTNTFIVDGVTVATVEGQPNKVRRSKAAGLCNGGPVIKCTAQGVDGQLFVATLDQTPRAQ